MVSKDILKSIPLLFSFYLLIYKQYLTFLCVLKNNKARRNSFWGCLLCTSDSTVCESFLSVGGVREGMIILSDEKEVISKS